MFPGKQMQVTVGGKKKDLKTLAGNAHPSSLSPASSHCVPSLSRDAQDPFGCSYL